jgi:tetratricopeptide (TPR) repeat protein
MVVSAGKKPVHRHRWFDIGCIIVLVVLTLTPYLQVVNFDFVMYDDPDYVLENDHVKDGVSLTTIRWALTTGHASNWHPLTWISHCIDGELFGVQPGGHHAHNLLLHLINTILLFIILRRLTGRQLESMIVAALFAVHPLNVQSAAWISERKNLLSTLFWLLTIWSYAGYVARPRTARYLGVVAAFTLGLLSKPMVVTLPFVLLLLDWWPLGRVALDTTLSTKKQPANVTFRIWRRWRLLCIEKIPLIGMSVAACGITFWAQNTGGAIQSLQVFPLALRLQNALVAYVVYLKKMVLPNDLSFFYPFIRTIPAWQVVGAVCVLASISWMVIRLRNKHPYLLMGWLWYLGTMVPVIGLVQVGDQALADRYAYVPLIGLFVAIAWFLADVAAQRTAWRLTGWIGIILALAAATSRETSYWKNSRTLFEHALKISNSNYVAHNNLGNILAKEKKYDLAKAHYIESLKADPGSVEAHNNLGELYQTEGKIPEAIAEFKKALITCPNYAKVDYNLGLAYDKLGDFKKAIEYYQLAQRNNPALPEVYYNLGNVYSKTGSRDEAIAQFRQAIRVKPRYPKAYFNLGNMLAAKNQLDDALACYNDAIRLDSNFLDAYHNLGNIHMVKGEYQQAAARYRMCLQLNPQSRSDSLSLQQALAQSRAP